MCVAQEVTMEVAEFLLKLLVILISAPWFRAGREDSLSLKWAGGMVS
jgi:hypothetical protein